MERLREAFAYHLLGCSSGWGGTVCPGWMEDSTFRLHWSYMHLDFLIPHVGRPRQFPYPALVVGIGMVPQSPLPQSSRRCLECACYLVMLLAGHCKAPAAPTSSHPRLPQRHPTQEAQKSTDPTTRLPAGFFPSPPPSSPPSPTASNPQRKPPNSHLVLLIAVDSSKA